MSTGGDLRCQLCSKAVPRSSDRRSLAIPSSADVASELKECTQRVLPQLTFGSDSSYVCRSCFNLIEKFHKYRMEVETKLRQAAHLYQPQDHQRGEKEEEASASTPRSSKRRSMEDRALDSTPRAQRRRISQSLDTPIGHLQSCEESSIVAVCCMHICIVTILLCWCSGPAFHKPTMN